MAAHGDGPGEAPTTECRPPCSIVTDGSNLDYTCSLVGSSITRSSSMASCDNVTQPNLNCSAFLGYFTALARRVKLRLWISKCLLSILRPRHSTIYCSELNERSRCEDAGKKTRFDQVECGGLTSLNRRPVSGHHYPYCQRAQPSNNNVGLDASVKRR